MTIAEMCLLTGRCDSVRGWYCRHCYIDARTMLADAIVYCYVQYTSGTGICNSSPR